MQWVRQLWIRILGLGGPRSRCAANWAAPAPAGIFLLGSDSSFCFSPLVIILLCFLVYKRLSMCRLLSPRRILWIRCCVIPRGNSDAQSLETQSVSNTQRLMGQGLEPRFLNLYLMPCWPPVIYIGGNTNRLTPFSQFLQSIKEISGQIKGRNCS